MQLGYETNEQSEMLQRQNDQRHMAKMPTAERGGTALITGEFTNGVENWLTRKYAWPEDYKLRMFVRPLECGAWF